MTGKVFRRDPSKERYWREVLQRQAGSGLTVRAFCGEEGVRESAFYFWRRELEKRRQERGAKQLKEVVKTEVGKSRTAKTTFVPVSLGERIGAIEVALPSGVVVRLPAATELSSVAALLVELERRPC